MDQSRALHKLHESADLLTMIESLLDPSVMQHISPTTLAGVRITLRNVREEVLSSHDALASSFVARTRAPESSAAPSPIMKGSAPSSHEGDVKRRDLRATIEKAVMDRQHQQ